MTSVISNDGLVTDRQLLAMLRTIGDLDAADRLDNATLSRSLGWTAAKTAATLGAARSRLLIWGIRVGGTPAPCFEDILLTVRGRRRVEAVES
jgi:hypothetical protein